jgi:Neprosin
MSTTDTCTVEDPKSPRHSRSEKRSDARCRALVAALVVSFIAMSGILAPCAGATPSPAFAQAGTLACNEATAANRVPPPPPIWELPGGTPPTAAQTAYSDSLPALCPQGQVPDITPPAGPAIKDLGSQSASQTALLSGNLSPAANEYKGECETEKGTKYEIEGKPYCYWHVIDTVEKPAIGMLYETDISEPTVSSFPGAHSIDQLWAIGDGGESTFEVGFTVSPTQFSAEEPEPARQPHFFVFVNPDNYGPEACYVGRPKCTVVYTPIEGETVTPNEVFTNSTTTFKIGVKYYDGNWWVFAGTKWQGYVPGSYWGGKFTEASKEENGGEVADSEIDPTSQMGDGQYGRSTTATFMDAPIIIRDEHGAEVEEPTSGEEKFFETNKAIYDQGAHDVGGPGEWHFGGPGADPAPLVTTEGSSVIPPSSVELKGSADPNNLETTYYFQYGPTISYGSVTATEPAGSGVEPVSVNAKITDLKPGTTYHYRLVAHNEDGYGYGADSTFTVPWWYIQSTQNPHGSIETDQLRGVSCWSASGCDAVGTNTNSANEIVGLVERWNGTSWEVQSTPKGAGAKEDNLESVSCLSASECEASGYAEVAEGKHVTLAERWNGTAWAIQTIPATTGSNSNLTSVSCASASECVASGFSTPTAGKSAALVELWNGKEWKTQTTATLPKEDEKSSLESVSCPSSKHCTAVGSVTNKQGIAPLIESYNGSSWTLQSAPAPEHSIELHLRSVSCSSSSVCTAVGEYENYVEKAERPLVERYNGTSWELQEAASPVGKPAPKGSHWSLSAVSCPTASSCVAVGSYAESASGKQLLLGEEWNASRWELATPIDRTIGLYDEARSVSCSAALTCTLAGTSWKEHNNTETLAERIWEP